MIEVPASVGGAIRFDAIPPKLHGRLARAFSFSNPEFYRLQAMGRNMAHSNVPAKIEVAIDDPRFFSIPRGGVSLVKEVSLEHGFRVRWIDERTKGSALEIPKRHDEDPDAITLRPFQDEGIARVKKSTQGSIIIGCGGGKTALGIVAIERLKRTAIVFVHTGDLLDQWIEGLWDRLRIRAGVVADGKINPGPVTVAMIQTVSKRLDDPAMLELLRGAGVAVLDEAHHAPALTFRRVMDHCPAYYRIGLTATPKRDDGLTRIFDWTFGERLIEVPTKVLLRMGYLMRPSLEVVRTDFTFESGQKDRFKRSIEIARALEAYEPRAHAIASIVAANVKDGQRVLVLANRKAYARQLGRLIWEYGAEALTITGETAKKARKEMIAKFRAGDAPCVVATSLANEGLDAPKLSRIVFAWPESSDSAADQKTGRLMRIAQKVPVLIDVVDQRVPELVRRYESRARTYRRLGMNPPKKGDL